MTGKKTLIIAGFAPRMPLELPCQPKDTIDRLVSSFNGRPAPSDLPAQGAGLVFGGLPISERDFVDALLRFGTYDQYCILVNDPARKRVVEADLLGSIDSRLMIRSVNEIHKEDFGETVVHSPFSNPVSAIATRERFFSPTTPIHLFLSGLCDAATVVPGVQALFAAGQPFDSLTAVSSSNRTTAENILAYFTSYYEREWGVQRTFLGRFTKARLGVNLDGFDRDSVARLRLRSKLGIDPEATLFLYLGRLGPAYKADLVPLMYAFAQEFVRSGETAMLILAGYDEGAADGLTALAQVLEAGKQVKVIRNVSLGEKKLLYSIADVFVSPSDSIQEAFGITLIEAMACGLPVIVSDWDGYRETVENNVNGFLVTTRWSAAVDRTAEECGVLSGMDRHCFYAQNLCVDLPELRRRMRLLESDASLRQAMSERARSAAQRYNWSALVPILEDEWKESLEIAQFVKRTQPRQRAKTLYGLDMQAIHHHYPSTYYSDSDLVVASHSGLCSGGYDHIGHLLGAVDLPVDMLQTCTNLYLTLFGGPARYIGEFALEFANRTGSSVAQVKYCLFRLVKYGLLEITTTRQSARA